MPELKNPIFSLRAQGSLGQLQLSNHHGRTYAYMKSDGPTMPASDKQLEIRADFVKSIEYWQGFEPHIKHIFTYLKDNKRHTYIKDCKRARMTPMNTWQSIYFLEVPQEIHGAALVVVVAYVILKYGWVLLFF